MKIIYWDDKTENYLYENIILWKGYKDDHFIIRAGQKVAKCRIEMYDKVSSLVKETFRKDKILFMRVEDHELKEIYIIEKEC